MRQNIRPSAPTVAADDKSGRLRLNDDRIEKVINLLEDADSVELKLTVPDSDRASTISALDVDPLDAQLRQAVFFDTPGLRLNRTGIVVRARRILKGGDAVVKLRPMAQRLRTVTFDLLCHLISPHEVSTFEQSPRAGFDILSN